MNIESLAQLFSNFIVIFYDSVRQKEHAIGCKLNHICLNCIHVLAFGHWLKKISSSSPCPLYDHLMAAVKWQYV